MFLGWGVTLGSSPVCHAQSQQPPKARASASGKPASETRTDSSKTTVRQELPVRFLLIYLSNPTPIFVELDVLIDGQPWPGAGIQQQSQQLWEQCDKDHSRSLNSEERKAVIPLIQEAGRNYPEARDALLSLLQSTTDDQDLSQDVFLPLALAAVGGAPQLQGKLRSLSRAVELFDLVDQDNNGQVTVAELAAMRTRLSKLDLDDDESYSIIEVEPFRNPFSNRAQNAQQSAGAESWVLATNLESLNPAAARRLLEHYDGHAARPKEGALELAELELKDPGFAAADRDQTGSLNRPELAQWLTQVRGEYRLLVDLAQTNRTRTKWTWQAPNRPLVSMTTPRAVTMGPKEIELRATAARKAQADNRQFLRLEFRKADADKNKYLDQTEFASFGMSGGTFDQLDADKNGQVFENELLAFLDQQKVATQAQIIVTVERDEKSLFSLLDADQDRRLTPRELVAPEKTLLQLDVNRDQVLSRDELQGRLRLTISLQEPDLFRNATAARSMMAGGDAILGTRTGPDWFQAMDQNRDQSVSEREFLGPWELFEHWDLDRDGLLSAAEAEQMTAQQPDQPSVEKSESGT